MNTSKLQTYAPKARRDFIAAVTRRAALFGLTANGTSQVREEGQLVFIEGQPHPKSVGIQRQKLAVRVQQQGFEQVMEAAAYTWFNRFAAIRFMELHGYLDHSFRVLSHPAGNGLPEILEHAQQLDLPDLDQERVVDLKMDGTRDEELYRDLLLAQCRALNRAMPFLFERVDDETELLLPDNLLQTDSLIRELVTTIPEEDWQEIEIIGWLYQFYISEKKDHVIGKVVKSEDIPAATQLFTPNWIVKYMVQNSLGAQWLATYRDSPLKAQMGYYIESAEQTEEVRAQLAAITPSALNPEELTLIDPACGSGHILVEAYELFKAIYLERGYRQRDVPKLILEKNLFGLDIDGRAAQLTGFALMMKGRADDRRLFERGVKLNVMALMDSAGFDAERLAQGVKLSDYGLKPGDLAELKRLFEHATTFGSLIQVPEGLKEKLPALKQLSEATSQDLFVSDALVRFKPLVRQAEMLVAQYDAVVANPPYMGSRYMDASVKKFVKGHYSSASGDLCTCFLWRCLELVKDAGLIGMISLPNWLFLPSFSDFRENLLVRTTFHCMSHNGRGVFGADFGSCSFVIRRMVSPAYLGSFKRLFDAESLVLDNDELSARLIQRPAFLASVATITDRPGMPIAYWISATLLKMFGEGVPFEALAPTKQGLATADNDRFLRVWTEVDVRDVGWSIGSREEATASENRWFPYSKGGSFRRWYGNNYLVVDWKNDGHEIRSFRDDAGKVRSATRNMDFYFREAVTWSLTSVTQGGFAARHRPEGCIFDTNGMSAFPTEDFYFCLAFLNSCTAFEFLKVINPTFAFQAGDIARVPVQKIADRGRAASLARECAELSKNDWDADETSWDFQSLPLLTASSDPTHTLESSYTAWITQNRDTVAEMKRLEEENNRLFIDAYGLQDELTPEVPIERITLTVNPAYRYGGKLAEEEQWTRFREDSMGELVSYAIGCMMGRYSLDEPGLIYADSGNEDFDPSRYTSFPADDDGIVPLTDTDWFEDDAAHRLIEFISVPWDASHLEDNLSFLANNLSPRKNESSRETIRRYLCDSFFKDHLQTYKKRPIYWLFSSGKQKAFQCLVYLHRYNEGTLARMRMEYVVPLQSKMAARIDKLADDIQAATTSAQAKRLQKERDKLTRQLDELRRFDEQLRHYADLRIKLDLNDGVKVNYGKFGDLLAEVKAVTGKKPD